MNYDLSIKFPDVAYDIWISFFLVCPVNIPNEPLHKFAQYGLNVNILMMIKLSDSIADFVHNSSNTSKQQYSVVVTKFRSGVPRNDSLC